MLVDHILAILLIQLISITGVANADVTGDELICPDDIIENCYPKLFVPSDDWKPVRPGQIIPPGLQVRLSLDDDNREAKYVDNYHEKKASDGDKRSVNYKEPKKHALAIVDSETPLAKGVQYIQDLFKNGRIPRKIVYGETLDHLTTLEEASSDMESGVLISKALQSLLHLTGLYDDDNSRSFGLTFRQLNSIKDLSYRTLASSFRNNDEAQQELIEHVTDQVNFLKRLVNHDDNGIVSKSRLGLMSSILNNNNFDAAFIKGGIEKELLKLYGISTDFGVKNRILLILEDRQIEKREDTEENGETDFSTLSSDERYAKLIESVLIKSSLVGDKDAQTLLNTLKSLKIRKNTVFKASNPFLEWLSLEIGNAKERLKRDNNEDYVEELILLRHDIFGNHLGSRKDFDL